MAEYVILIGVGLCALSVILAVIWVIRMRPPRPAAITLLLGIALIALGAWLSPEPFTFRDLPAILWRSTP